MTSPLTMESVLEEARALGFTVESENGFDPPTGHVLTCHCGFKYTFWLPPQRYDQVGAFAGTQPPMPPSILKIGRDDIRAHAQSHAREDSGQ